MFVVIHKYSYQAIVDICKSFYSAQIKLVGCIVAGAL